VTKVKDKQTEHHRISRKVKLYILTFQLKSCTAPARANNNSFLQQEMANLTSYMINTTTNCQKFVTVNVVQKMNSYSKFVQGELPEYAVKMGVI